jgi:hypothetical protein
MKIGKKKFVVELCAEVLIVEVFWLIEALQPERVELVVCSRTGQM